MKTVAAFAVVLTTMTLACAVDGTGSGTASLLDQCSGSYQCDDGRTSGSFHKNGGACMANSTDTFNPDGTVFVEGSASNETWSGDAHSFQWCSGTDCLTCTVSAPSIDAGTSGGKCTGATYGCEEQVAPYCSDVSGCYMATRIGPNNSFENYCTGYADACSEMDTEATCKKQGCSWKP